MAKTVTDEGDGPKPGELDPAKLIAARTAKGLSQSDLAREIGVTPQAISAMELGEIKKPRSLREIAAAVDKSPEWLVVAGDNLAVQSTMQVQFATVRGIAAGGLWQAENREVIDPVPVPASPDSRYSKLPQVAYRVVGTSMNKRVRDGEYVICVDYREHPVALREGDVVVAERHRGGEIERTVKLVRMTRGRTELWPESDDPQYQKPLILKAREEGTTVMVVGLVVGYYRPA